LANLFLRLFNRHSADDDDHNGATSNNNGWTTRRWTITMTTQRRTTMRKLMEAIRWRVIDMANNNNNGDLTININGRWGEPEA
jgi:hypothetical protein